MIGKEKQMGLPMDIVDQKIMAVRRLEKDRIAISIAVEEDAEEIVHILLIKYAAGEISLFDLFQKWRGVCDLLGKLWAPPTEIPYAEILANGFEASDRNGFVAWIDCFNNLAFNSEGFLDDLLEENISKEDLIEIIKTKSSGFYYSW